MKKLIYIVGGLVVLLVVLVGVAFAVVNAMSWNVFKPYIVDAARDATGRELAIDDLAGGLSLGGQLDLTMSGVRLANAEGMQPADMVSLGKVETTVQLLPFLLSDELKIDRLVIEKPVAALAVDKAGRPNWVFEGKDGGGKPSAGGGGGGDKLKVGIGELKISDGAFSYADAVSGQTVKAEQIQLAVAPTDLVTPLKVDGSLVLNKEPVKLTVDLDSPQKLIDGEPATAMLALASKHVQAGYDGKVLSQPVPGLDGKFKLDVPSVAKLAAWLDKPLAKGQPDPGPLKVRATFSGEGAKVALTEATVQGDQLDLKATGWVDATKDVTKVNLKVDSGVLDIDRYLPPPEKAPRPAAPQAKGKPGNPLEALSDEPIDVSGLRKLDADIQVTLAGLKVSGLSFGKIAFTATAKDGVANAELAPLALYGGTVAGKLGLDAKAVPAVDVLVKVDKVKVDEIAKAATGEAAVVGVASAEIKASSQGKSPRALAQAMVGKAGLRLGEVQNAPGGTLSEAVAVLDLPGGDKQPSAKGHVVFNKEKVNFAATLDPLQKVLSSDRFNADVKVTSQPVMLSYQGAVQYRPVPGGDGTFSADVPSVGKLLAWLGQPLDKSQPDPGPLKIDAVMATKGGDFEVKQATIKGKAIDAKAKLTLKAEKPAPRFDAQVDVLQANLNAYLPPEEKQAKAKPAAKPAAGAEQGWSREPIDFSGLRSANGKAVINLAKVKYKNLDVKNGRIVVTLEKGVADAEVAKLELAGGNIVASAKVDASGKAAKVNYKASVKNVAARPLLTAFADFNRISGTTNVEAEGTTHGVSQFDLVKALNGKGSVKFTDGAIHGINLAATLRKAQALGMSQDAGEEQKTDFAELGGTYTITNGVVDNKDFAMLAPLVRLAGAGQVPMPPRKVDYGVEAKLVPTLKGQGGKDALAGVPIPIKVTGTWANPSYEVDWKSVFQTLAKDPEKLANLPGGLADKAKDLGIALPGLGKAGDLLKGGKDSGGGVGGLLKGVTGGGTKTDGAAKATDQKATDKKKGAKDALKGLLKTN